MSDETRESEYRRLRNRVETTSFKFGTATRENRTLDPEFAASDEACKALDAFVLPLLREREPVLQALWEELRKRGAYTLVERLSLLRQSGERMVMEVQCPDCDRWFDVTLSRERP